MTTRSLYEEALADVKELRRVAEDNAKRAVLEAVTPRIRDLFEHHLLNVGSELEDECDETQSCMPSIPSNPPPIVPSGNVSTPTNVVVAPNVASVGVTVCDDEPLSTELVSDEEAFEDELVGSDDVNGEEDVHYELSMESVEALAPVFNLTKLGSTQQFDVQLFKLSETLKRYRTAGKLIGESKHYDAKINEIISRVENMYEYVQESVKDTQKKTTYEESLETLYQGFKELQETAMKKKNRSRVNEAELTLKLTNIPDGLEDQLDSVGVELITGDSEDEEMSTEEQPVEASGEEEESSEETSDLDLGDLGGEEEAPEESVGESLRLSDDTLVEVDVRALRREISRLRSVRESKNKASEKDILSDFGGGKDEGDAFLDGHVTTESQDFGDEDLDEVDACSLDQGEVSGEVAGMDQSDEDLEEVSATGGGGSWGMDQQDDMVDEQDDMVDEQLEDGILTPMGESDEVGDEEDVQVQESDDQDEDDLEEGSSTSQTSSSRVQSEARAAVKAKKIAEAKAAQASKDMNIAIKRGALAKRTGNKKLYAECKRAYRLAEATKQSCVARINKANKFLTEAKKRSNSVVTEKSAETQLRNQLTEANLLNAKLLYTNKLLQNESLSSAQKTRLVEQIDEAKSVKEVKLAYESVARTLGRSKNVVTEAKKREVIGSGSRISRPASTEVMNEGFETNRWAQLAGINN